MLMNDILKLGKFGCLREGFYCHMGRNRKWGIPRSRMSRLFKGRNEKRKLMSKSRELGVKSSSLKVKLKIYEKSFACMYRTVCILQCKVSGIINE